jgi:hypothetical protein
VLAKGFGMKEEEVTNNYIAMPKDGKSDKELFAELCSSLIDKARKARK